jgi:hypothetical protein
MKGGREEGANEMNKAQKKRINEGNEKEKEGERRNDRRK